MGKKKGSRKPKPSKSYIKSDALEWAEFFYFQYLESKTTIK